MSGGLEYLDRAMALWAACPETPAVEPETIADGLLTRPAAEQRQGCMALGLLARLDPDRTDSALGCLATLIRAADGSVDLRTLFQAPLLAIAEADGLAQTSPAAIQAIDHAIDAAVAPDAASSWQRPDRLAFVQGFFNHDVTPDEVRELRERWASMSATERDPVYPSFVHLGDRVAKPVSVMPLREPEPMAELLAESIDLLLLFLDQPIAPGRAYHPPTHAAMVLGPLLDRFGDDPVHGSLIRDRLGERDDFIQHLIAMLPGAQSDPAGMDEVEFTWRRYVGTFLANVLAKMGAREALPALQASLDLYQAHGEAVAIVTTRRALAALGDEVARSVLASAADLESASWLACHGVGEGRQWATQLLRARVPYQPAEPVTAVHQAMLIDSLNLLALTGH